MLQKIRDTSGLNNDLATLLLRLLLGGLMIYHGWQKIENYDKFAPMMKDLIGIGANLSFNLVIFAEFFCSILVVLGLFTRLSILPIIFSMSIALFIAHRNDPFMIKELAFAFLILAFIVFIVGSGKYSLDYLIRDKSKK